MDGNGRWAKKKGMLRMFGHETGVKTVKKITTEAARLGLDYLTVYAFSTENWNRPRLEVTALMKLLVLSIKSETKTLMKNGIKLKAIGNLDMLPSDCKSQLEETIKETKDNSKMTLILALSYGSQNDLAQATKKIAVKVKSGELDPGQITEETVKNHLSTAEYPNPELLIRTSGEQRISNFLLWEIAYAELYFTSVLWPEFDENELHKAILSYQNRERRFGKTSEQLNIVENK
jgi:undecaprenyl diphosphate synthase